MPDRKPSQSRRRDLLDRRPGDVAGHAPGDCVEERGDLVGIAFRDQFHVPVGEVAHPAVHGETGG